MWKDNLKSHPQQWDHYPTRTRGPTGAREALNMFVCFETRANGFREKLRQSDATNSPSCHKWSAHRCWREDECRRGVVVDGVGEGGLSHLQLTYLISDTSGVTKFFIYYVEGVKYQNLSVDGFWPRKKMIYIDICHNIVCPSKYQVSILLRRAAWSHTDLHLWTAINGSQRQCHFQWHCTRCRNTSLLLSIRPYLISSCFFSLLLSLSLSQKLLRQAS